MTKLFFAASAAALLTVAGTVPSFAQSSASGSTMMAPSITCKDLSTMDKETARSVVYYFSGFNAASGSSQAMNSSTGSSTTGNTGTSTTTADTTNSGSGSSTTTGSGSGSTTANAGSGSTTTDTTGSTTAAGSTAGSSDTSGASGSTASSGSSSAMVAQLPGFSSIDVDKIMTTCQSSPDKQLSEVIGSGSTAQ